MVALAGAGVLILTGQATRAQLGAAMAAERRIDLMRELATEVSDYGLLALEAERQSGPAPALVARLAEEGQAIVARLDQLDAAYARAVEAELGFDDRTRVASRSMGVARMRSAFATLGGAVGADPRSPGRRNELELFAAGFSPALNATIADEYRVRAAALDRIETLRRRGQTAAVAVGAASLALLGGFVAGAVRPVFRRLEVLLAASRRMAAGDLDVALPEGVRDEFGPLYDETSRLARRIAADRARVDTDRARLNEIVAERTAQLRAANARLAATDADRRRFFADISHELRTPLTVILMEADLAEREGDAKTSLEVIRQRARRLTRRVDDMLRVARSASGRIELEQTAVDLAAIAAAAVADAGRAAARIGVRIDAVSTGPVPAWGDPNWTRQVLEGLVDNALRHAGSGRRVRVIADRGADGPRLRVVDDGPGLGGDPAALLERFAKAEGGVPGFGIGLALARWIAEEQGGSIHLASPVPPAERLGAAPGTCVTLTLPEQAA
jgi:signal transduction histidine kinase